MIVLPEISSFTPYVIYPSSITSLFSWPFDSLLVDAKGVLMEISGRFFNISHVALEQRTCQLRTKE
jgi:hypothetical protein